MKNARRIKKSALILLLPFGIMLTYVSSLVPGLVETVYSNAVYKMIGQSLSLATGIFPFSTAEFIILLLVLFITLRLAMLIVKLFQGTPGKGHIILRSLTNMLIFASLIYFSFILLWGLNYHRLPFSRIAGLDIKPASVHELAEVCESIIDRANELRSKVGEDADGVMQLPDGKPDVFNRAYKGYDNAAEVYPKLGGKYGRPKGVMLSHLMSYTGISGVYFPFTTEANVNIAIPDSMLPSTTCHEMAHQRGFAREDEANYIAYLTSSLHPDADFQYSGTLLALIHSMNALYNHDQEKFKELYKKYSMGVMRDLADINDFWERYEGPVEEFSSDINDAYLKANRQQDGIQSYGRMVDLLIAEYRMKKSK